jgi:hypothetical protein
MSNERTITVTGTPDQIEAAILQIAETLKEVSGHRPIASGILYKPVPMSQLYNQGYPGMDMHYYDHNAAKAVYPPNRAMPAYPAHPYPAYTNPQVAMHHAHGYGVAPAAAHPQQGKLQSQQIYIPNEMVGSIIGKGGSKINEVRQMSGAHIKIADSYTDNGERLITISGTPEANQAALYLLYNRLEAEKSRVRK